MSLATQVLCNENLDVCARAARELLFVSFFFKHKMGHNLPRSAFRGISILMIGLILVLTLKAGLFGFFFQPKQYFSFTTIQSD